jgi:tol-pal system protein YbgF
MRILTGFLFLAGLLCACASHQPDAESIRITTMEKQIARNEEVLADLSHRLSVMQFMVDSHERMLRTSASPASPGTPEKPLSAPQTIQTPQTSQVSPQDPGKLYELAFATLQNREYEKAATLFRQLADTYPEHTLADNALYWLGECHYARKDYRAAIQAFEEVLNRYPKGGKVPDALLKNAFSRISIGDKEGGRTVLRQLIRDYPFTDAAAKAEARLKTLF